MGWRNPYGTGNTTLLELLAKLAAAGINMPSKFATFFPLAGCGVPKQLRAALDAAGVEFSRLLIDDGDITDPVNGERDFDWIASWIDHGRARWGRSGCA